MAILTLTGENNINIAGLYKSTKVANSMQCITGRLDGRRGDLSYTVQVFKIKIAKSKVKHGHNVLQNLIFYSLQYHVLQFFFLQVLWLNPPTRLLFQVLSSLVKKYKQAIRAAWICGLSGQMNSRPCAEGTFV